MCDLELFSKIQSYLVILCMVAIASWLVCIQLIVYAVCVATYIATYVCTYTYLHTRTLCMCLPVAITIATLSIEVFQMLIII